MEIREGGVRTGPAAHGAACAAGSAWRRGGRRRGGGMGKARTDETSGSCGAFARVANPACRRANS
eukprot:scaffold143190_cov32-Tisochrysis_lutea.AAC.2